MFDLIYDDFPQDITSVPKKAVSLNFLLVNAGATGATGANWSKLEQTDFWGHRIAMVGRWFIVRGHRLLEGLYLETRTTLNESSG